MQEPKIEDITLAVEDGHRVTMTVYGSGNGPVIYHSCAMGVRASLYHALGLDLARQGLIFATADPRGHGSSNLRPSRRCNYGYAEMLADIDAAVTLLQHKFPGRPLYLMGHSLGGQLSCLFAAANPHRIAGVTLVASCSIYWRCYSEGPALRGLVAALNPILLICGYFPGETLKFAGKESRQVMRDWAYQSRTGRYKVARHPQDFEASMAAMTLPVLVLPVRGDRFAPKKAVDHLCAKMGRATITRTQIELPNGKRGKGVHFSWTRSPHLVTRQFMPWLASMQTIPVMAAG